MKKRVVILGAGLAGLRSASVLIDHGYDVTVIERAPMAGGCTSSWVDNRDPEKNTLRKGQMQMNFPFYENLNYFAWRELNAPDLFQPGQPSIGSWDKGNSAYSDRLDGFYFVDENGRRSHLSASPKSTMGKVLKALPAPLSTLQVFWDFDGIPTLRDKLSAVKFHRLAMIFGDKVAPPINDDWNFFGLMKHLGMSYEAIRAYRRITYSITNLSDADQVGPKFLHLFYLAYLRDKDVLGCRMMNDDCNPALIDPVVASLSKRGVKFLFESPVRDILIEKEKCVGVVIDDLTSGKSLICDNCGLSFKVTGPVAFCSVCGNNFAIDQTVPSQKKTIEADYFISALQPHQLATIYRSRDDHPLRQYPFFRALGQFRGAELTISRIFMDAKVTDEYNLTGLDRDYFSMNGCMDLSHIMPKYREKSVFDTLSDDGEVLNYYPTETLKAKLREDLKKIFPTSQKARVKKHLLARLSPDVLYHRGVPRLNSRFLPHRPNTPISNFFLAGDWVEDLELGKEAAVKSGISAANSILESDSLPLEPILYPSIAPMVSWFQTNPVSRWVRSRYEKRFFSELPPKRG